jgi:hypothetical protein
MTFIRSRTGKLIAGLFAAAILVLPMAPQADAATTTVRLHAATATGESLKGPGIFGSAVLLTPTNVNASLGRSPPCATRAASPSSGRADSSTTAGS